MSLQSDWLNEILFQSQLLYSKTINRGPHNSEKRQKILNKKLEKLCGKTPFNSLQSSKFKNSSIQVQERSRSRPSNSRTSLKPLNSNKSQDQDKVQVQVNHRFKNKL